MDASSVRQSPTSITRTDEASILQVELHVRRHPIVNLPAVAVSWTSEARKQSITRYCDVEQPPADGLKIFEDVACTQCGCVCDDLRITVAEGRVVKAERACEIAEPWLFSQNTQSPAVAEIHGQAAPLEDAIRRAAEILAAARAPLIYGLSRSS